MKILIENFETCNIGNDIYMSNITSLVRKVTSNKAFISERPIARDFVLSRSIGSLGKFIFKKDNLFNSPYKIYDQVDLVILSGPWISTKSRCTEGLKIFLEDLRRKKIPYGFISVGSYFYNKEEKNYFSDLLKKYPPLFFTSRDNETFYSFSKFAKYSLMSICNSFFSPINFPKDNEKDLVGCWDDNKIFKYSELLKIIELIGISELQKYRPIISPIAAGNIMKLKIRNSPIPCLLSVSFHDYLDFYSKTSLMLSSRVHCCAPTLAYGGKAILLNNSPRKYLFDAAEVKKEKLDRTNFSIMSIEIDYIQEKYMEIYKFLKNVFQSEWNI